MPSGHWVAREALLDEAEKEAKKAKKDAEKKEADKKDNKKKDTKKGDDAKKETPKKEAKKPLVFDLDNCKDRIVRLTVNSSHLGDAVLSPRGDTLYYQAAMATTSGATICWRTRPNWC